MKNALWRWTNGSAVLSGLAIRAGIASDRDDLSGDSDADFAENGRRASLPAFRPSATLAAEMLGLRQDAAGRPQVMRNRDAACSRTSCDCCFSLKAKSKQEGRLHYCGAILPDGHQTRRDQNPSPDGIVSTDRNLGGDECLDLHGCHVSHRHCSLHRPTARQESLLKPLTTQCPKHNHVGGPRVCGTPLHAVRGRASGGLPISRILRTAVG